MHCTSLQEVPLLVTSRYTYLYLVMSTKPGTPRHGDECLLQCCNCGEEVHAVAGLKKHLKRCKAATCEVTCLSAKTAFYFSARPEAFYAAHADIRGPSKPIHYSRDDACKEAWMLTKACLERMGKTELLAQHQRVQLCLAEH